MAEDTVGLEKLAVDWRASSPGRPLKEWKPRLERIKQRARLKPPSSLSIWLVSLGVLA
ncbi:MAG: hypothetical protein Q8P67_09475 [archaeon]|nr:hypothetical protein [archaeon]